MTAILAGCRALVVEDESAIAMMIEDMLIEAGCEVEVASQLEQAVALAGAGRFDLAVLDINLHGRESFEAADLLTARNVPVIFASGYGQSGRPARYQHLPMLQKPFACEELISAARTALGRA
jgi:DNA-binding response OmpR family regulator